MNILYTCIKEIHWTRGFTALNDPNPHIQNLYFANLRPNCWMLLACLRHYPKRSIPPFQAASMSCWSFQHEKQTFLEFPVLVHSDSKKMQTIFFRHLLFIVHKVVRHDCRPSACCCHDCRLLYWFCTRHTLVSALNLPRLTWLVFCIFLPFPQNSQNHTKKWNLWGAKLLHPKLSPQSWGHENWYQWIWPHWTHGLSGWTFTQ